MCTLTHRVLEDGFELFFNRDEKRARGAELPPRCETLGGVTVVAPRDSDFGGSWIAVNDRGLGVAILNGYRSADPAAGEFSSRGSLVLEIASRNSLDSALAVVAKLDPAHYRSFVLVIASPGLEPAIVEWDRSTVVIDRNGAARLPLFSSSFRGSEVANERRKTFESLGRPSDSQGLLAFHRSHQSGPGPYSVCMHREDAETRSFTRIEVTPRDVTLEYRPKAPCRESQSIVVSLRRRAAAE